MNGEVLYWTMGWIVFSVSAMMPDFTESGWRHSMETERIGTEAFFRVCFALIAWYCAHRAGASWK